MLLPFVIASELVVVFIDFETVTFEHSVVVEAALSDLIIDHFKSRTEHFYLMKAKLFSVFDKLEKMHVFFVEVFFLLVIIQVKE